MVDIQLVNSIRDEFTKKCKSKNGISFWAFLLSIFIYISVFYVFNLSPFALFNTTKFWFFISNTLILIIVADFGAFFATQTTHAYNLQDNYFDQKIPPPCLSLSSQEKLPEEIIKDIVFVADQKNESHIDKSEITQHDQQQKKHADQDSEENSARKMKRSQSELLSIQEDRKNKIPPQRSQSEKKYDHNYDDDDDRIIQENDLWKISDEELNRRVEQFIQNFNRQIRLQAASKSTL